MSNDLTRVVLAEWHKLKHRRTTVVVPVIVIILALIIFFALDLVARRQWIGLPSGFYLTGASLSWMINVVLLVTVVATCFHISGEFAMGTIKAVWVRPLTRRGWYTGKIVSAMAAITGLFLLVVVVIVGLSALRFGFTDLMEKDFLLHPAGSLWWGLFLTIVLTLLALWAIIAVVAMLATLFNHPGGAIAAGLGLGLLMMILAVFAEVRPFLLNTLVSLPTMQMTAMAKGLPLPLEWSQLVWRVAGGAGVWMAVSLFVGYQVIARKEITF